MKAKKFFETRLDRDDKSLILIALTLFLVFLPIVIYEIKAAYYTADIQIASASLNFQTDAKIAHDAKVQIAQDVYLRENLHVNYYGLQNTLFKILDRQ